MGSPTRICIALLDYGVASGDLPGVAGKTCASMPRTAYLYYTFQSAAKLLSGSLLCPIDHEMREINEGLLGR